MRRLVLLFMLVFSCLTFAYAETFTEGQDYRVVNSAPATKPVKPAIVEYFSYGCPACFGLEKTLQPWLHQHADTMTFSRVPVVFHEIWELYAKAYYLAKSLDILPEASKQLFQAIQVEHQPLDTTSRMTDFFVTRLHVDPHLVESAFDHAITLDLQIKEGVDESVRLEIVQVPGFVVNGRYKTDMGMAKNPARLLAILDALMKKD